MAYAAPNAWYTSYGNGSSTGYYAVTVRPQNTAVAAGILRRQFTAPATNSERVFVCIVAGTTANTTDATWTTTKGAKTTDGTATWQECTGQPAVNGDISSGACPVWTVSSTPALGTIIYHAGTSSLQICSTSGAGGSGGTPSFSGTAGVTTADSSATWTSLGAASNFAAWAAPHARLKNAFTSNWGAAGNDFWVADNHAETQSTTMLLNAPGTAASPCRIMCVDHTASVPPGTANLNTGATVTGSSSSNGAVQLNTTNGAVNYYYGITFIASSASASSLCIWVGDASTTYTKFENCSFQLTGVGAGSANVRFGTGTTNVCSTTELVNTTFSFSTATQAIYIFGGIFRWRNTASALLGTALTGGLFTAGDTTTSSDILVEGVDLSGLGTNCNIVLGASAGYTCIKDCKLNSAAAICSAPGAANGINLTFDLSRCDSGGTNYRNERYTTTGTLTTNTAIVRTGGASDGTTPVSHKIVTQATYPQWYSPFPCLPITIWNTVVSPTDRTVTIYGVVNGTAVPNNDEFWFDVEYLGASGSPLGSFASGTKSNTLASGSALTADTSAWDTAATAWQSNHAYALGDIIKASNNVGRIFFCTSAGTSTNGAIPAGYGTAVDGGLVTDNGATFRAGCRFSQSITVSPKVGQVGYMTVYPKAAKASTTYFIDPLIALS